MNVNLGPRHTLITVTIATKAACATVNTQSHGHSQTQQDRDHGAGPYLQGHMEGEQEPGHTKH